MVRRISILLTFWIGLVPAVLSAASIRAPIADGLEAHLDSEYEISVSGVVRDGDAWTRFALRLTGDASNWKKLAELNRMGENLHRGASVRVPWSMLKPELRIAAVRSLFPDDTRVEGGWLHVVRAGTSLDGEPLWKIADWFTGDPTRYTAIREANRQLGLTTRVGDRIVIPEGILIPPLRALRAGASPTVSLPAAVGAGGPATGGDALEVREGPAEGRAVEPATTVITHAASREDLTYTSTGGRDFAVYRLRKGEALWSSVVVRFTGLVFAKDVNEAVERIVAVNAIEDVSRIHVGAPIRIPTDLLMPEYLPSHDTRRVEYERSVAESSRAGRRVRARNLEGVHVIIDPGHGGRDVGTIHEDVWESTHVYDVSMHLKELLEQNSGAKVWMTTRSRDGGFTPASSDSLRNRTDHMVLTTPNYTLQDAVVGVNLRWYLSNAVYRRLIDDGVPAEKVLFLSIHADSLHPSLRGAMAYIPGNRYVQGTYRKTGDIYLARAEVREAPVVEQTAAEALRAEGLSRELAQAIVTAFANQSLPVHPFKPVRDNVVRSGREWVPAVIRYNKVPTRLLLEICNMGNEQDRKLIATRSHRQATAQAIFAGIVDFYATRDDMPTDAPRVLMTAAE